MQVGRSAHRSVLVVSEQCRFREDPFDMNALSAGYDLCELSYNGDSRYSSKGYNPQSGEIFAYSASSWCRLLGARSASVNVYGEYVATRLDIHLNLSSFSVAYIRMQRCSSVMIRGGGVYAMDVNEFLTSRMRFKTRIQYEPWCCWQSEMPNPASALERTWRTTQSTNFRCRER